MASSLSKQLKGLILNAAELRHLTGWSSEMVEDYLTILENLIALAIALDGEIDKKIEETPIGFIDGSIPFVESEVLVEDNTNLFWDNILKILVLANIIILDNGFIGLGVTKGRMQFTDKAVDEIDFLDCDVKINGSHIYARPYMLSLM